MKTKILLLLILLFGVRVFSETEGIYGEDDRRYVVNTDGDNVYSNDDYLQLSRSICLIVPKTMVDPLWRTVTGDPVPYPIDGWDLLLFGKLESLLETTFGTPVSSEVKFKDEYVVDPEEIGTGVIIGDRQILTVDHLFENQGPENFVAICNWIETDWKNDNRNNFNAYYCFQLDGYENYNGEQLKQIKIPGSNDRMDLSIIRTDRKIDKDVVPLNIATFTDIKTEIAGKELFMIGHPMGLPQVLADNAFINTNVKYETLIANKFTNLVNDNSLLTQKQFDRLLFANLDGFGGNSGSPVFVKDNKYKWLVVGIFTGGENDWDASTGSVKEKFYTPWDFQNGKAMEHFQTLENFPTFNEHCYNDCDYIQIQEKQYGGRTIKNELGLATNLCIDLPRGLNVRNGMYIVVVNGFQGGRTTYLDGDPAVSRLCLRVRKDNSYLVQLFNVIAQRIDYSTRIYEPVNDDRFLLVAEAFENEASLEGFLTDKVNFLPNIRSGECPLIVSFKPFIPYNDVVQTFHWDFGDGSTSNLMHPTHKYTSPGIYDVKLNVQISYVMPPEVVTRNYEFPDCIEVTDSKDLLQIDGKFKKFPLFATTALKMNDRSSCVDWNNLFMPIACGNGTVELGQAAHSGDIFSRGRVTLRSAIVHGDIQTGSDVISQYGGLVWGSIKQHITIPESILPTSFTIGNTTFTGISQTTTHVEPGTTCELMPGKYYDYNIKPGAKLKLAGGIYNFYNLVLDVNSELELIENYEPVRIYVQNRFDCKATINHTLEGAAGPRNFLVGYSGTNNLFLSYGFSGTLVAPNAFLSIGQATKIYEGMFVAKSIELHQDAVIKFTPFSR